MDQLIIAFLLHADECFYQVLMLVRVRVCQVLEKNKHFLKGKVFRDYKELNGCREETAEVFYWPRIHVIKVNLITEKSINLIELTQYNFKRALPKVELMYNFF